MHDRLAHQLVVERGLAHVPLHEDERGIHLPAIRRRRDALELRQAPHLEAFHVAAAQHVDGALLEGHGARGRVRHDAEVEFVEVGHARFPVVLVLHEVDVGAALPLLELEGTGADGRLVGRVGAIVRAVIDVFRHHGEGTELEGVEEGRERPLELEHHRIRRGRRDALDVGVGDVAPARMRLAQELVGGEDDVLGRERLAVVPLHPLLDGEGVGEPVLRHLPGLGERRQDLEVLPVAQEALVDLAADVERRPLGVEPDHEHRRLGLGDHVERAARRRLLLRTRRRGERETGKADEPRDQPARLLHPLPLAACPASRPWPCQGVARPVPIRCETKKGMKARQGECATLHARPSRPVSPLAIVSS